MKTHTQRLLPPFLSRFLLFLLLLAAMGSSQAAVVTATYNSATDIPVTAAGYTATGNTVNFTLNFAPPIGTTLTVVKNTARPFITGTFGNLAQGQTVAMTFGGSAYNFVANYYGGTGNDLVLVWKPARVLAWGYGTRGQLGNNTTVNSSLPVPIDTSGVLAGKTVLTVAVGGQHTLALCMDGTLAAWGNGGNGQTDGQGDDSSVPLLVNVAAGSALFGKTVVAIAAGVDHSIALCSDGTVAGWGFGDYGQLGNGTGTESGTPVTVAMTGPLVGKSVVNIAASGHHNVALCADGTVIAWGLNSSGQLGDNSLVNRLAPVPVTTATGALNGRSVVAIGAGDSHGMALCSDGVIAAWGSNTYGQLGDNSTTQRVVPVVVNAVSGISALFGKTVVAIAPGGAHSLAQCSDGTLAAWGYNADGRFGDNTTIQRPAPVVVNAASGISALAGRTVEAIAAGAAHSAARCSDATLAAWGSNAQGQLGDNTTINRQAPVTVQNTALSAGERFTSLFAGASAVHSVALASPVAPTVTTAAPAAVAASSATLGGDVTSGGGVAVTERGIVWATTSNPTTSNTKALVGSGTGSFTGSVTGLPSATLIYARA